MAADLPDISPVARDSLTRLLRALSERPPGQPSDDKYAQEIVAFIDENAGPETRILAREIQTIMLGKQLSEIYPLLRNQGTHTGDAMNMRKSCVDFLILTVKDVERDAILAAIGFSERHRVPKENRHYWKGVVSIGPSEEYHVVVTKCADAGNLDALASTKDGIRHWQPTAVLMVGIAAGILEEQKPGDIVVGKDIYYYERGKLSDGSQEPEPQMYPANFQLWSYVDNLDKWQPNLSVKPPAETSRLPTLHKEVIASGEKVLADAVSRDELLKRHRKIRAVEMEGFGFCKACHESHTQVAYLVIRAITDYGDKHKDDLWHEFAMASAADFIKHFLTNRPIKPQGWNNEP